MGELDDAADRLLSGDKMAGMIDLIRCFGMEDVPFNRGHAAAMAKRHSVHALAHATWDAYLYHRNATLAGDTGLGNWTEYAAKVLSNGKTETVGAPKPKPTEKQEAVIQGLMRMGKKRAAAEPLVLEMIAGLSEAELVLAALKKLDAERAAS